MTDRLFDAFAQSEQSLARTHGGLGLGLAWVRQIVELHCGTVKAVSPGPNLGSKFTIRLALCAPAPDAVPVEVPVKQIGNCVLIVEDQEDSRLRMSMLLELMGHRVYEASDGEEGLDRLHELRPDLELVDVDLPDLDGLTLARRARNDPELSRIRLPPVIRGNRICVSSLSTAWAVS